MVRTLFLAILLAGVLALLSQALQRRVQAALRRAPARIWLVPPLLTGVFFVASALMDSVNWELVLIVGAYTAAPVACAWFAGVGPVKRPVALDFAAIALLWFPLEFPAGAGRLIAKHAQGFLHSVAYGIAILLGLAIFLCFRQVAGMKYRLPESARDWRNMVVGFAVTAPVLSVVGIAVGFIPLPHAPTASLGRMASAAVIIFCATGLPEEILFRSMIQNLMFQRFGAGMGDAGGCERNFRVRPIWIMGRRLFRTGGTLFWLRLLGLRMARYFSDRAVCSRLPVFMLWWIGPSISFDIRYRPRRGRFDISPESFRAAGRRPALPKSGLRPRATCGRRTGNKIAGATDQFSVGFFSAESTITVSTGAFFDSSFSPVAGWS